MGHGPTKRPRCADRARLGLSSATRHCPSLSACLWCDPVLRRRSARERRWARQRAIEAGCCAAAATRVMAGTALLQRLLLLAEQLVPYRADRDRLGPVHRDGPLILNDLACGDGEAAALLVPRWTSVLRNLLTSALWPPSASGALSRLSSRLHPVIPRSRPGSRQGRLVDLPRHAAAGRLPHPAAWDCGPRAATRHTSSSAGQAGSGCCSPSS